MGLDLEVGIVSDLKRNDEEGYTTFKREFERLNQFLLSQGLKRHEEPETLSEDEVFTCQMWGYSGLHHLRKYAAYIALDKPAPEPSENDGVGDSIVEEYYDIATNNKSGIIARIFSRKQDQILRYQHLMLHGDAEGYYIPQDFEGVLFPPDELKMPGGMVGSVQRLYFECKELARLIELPVDMSPESEKIWGAADNHPGEGEKWQRYGIESFCCIRLIHACEHALKHNSAIVFC